VPHGGGEFCAWAARSGSLRFVPAMTIERFEMGPRMSQAVVYGGVAYLAGIVADDLVPSVGDQTRQILAKIDRILAAVGSDKTKILKANIWLSDIRRFDEMNEVWDGWVAKASPPARATVEARLAGPDYLVEIMVEAAVVGPSQMNLT
jgi:enamine deaminase RidA (YjgF/YER057c/UK114 family)